MLRVVFPDSAGNFLTGQSSLIIFNHQKIVMKHMTKLMYGIAMQVSSILAFGLHATAQTSTMSQAQWLQEMQDEEQKIADYVNSYISDPQLFIAMKE
jgi:hypothetical protein